MFGITGRLYAKESNWITFSHNTTTNSKWIEDFNAGHETIKLRRKRRHYVLRHRSWRYCILDLSPQARGTKARINRTASDWRGFAQWRKLNKAKTCLMNGKKCLQMICTIRDYILYIYININSYNSKKKKVGRGPEKTIFKKRDTMAN